MKLSPDHYLRTFDNGRVLIGGSPTTVMRLSPAGAAKVKHWFRGEPVSDGTAEARLALRLIETGIAHRVDTDSSHTYAVIIPVRNDPEGLKRTLEGLGSNQDLEVHVVHDSEPVAMGPAAARNLGAARTEADVLVFVDAGVQILPDQLRQLVSHIVGSTVAVAPRITSTPTAGRVGEFEATHSPLDMGALPGIARPGNRISYVPSTVLAVTRAAFEEVGGFESQLRYGEDVDLVWRLNSIGETRYIPSVVAQHPPRSSLAEFAKQRFFYGTSAGPLAARHGDDLAPVALSGWSVATLALVLVPLPKLTLLWLAGLSAGLSKKMPKPAAVALAIDATVRGNFAAVEAVALASTRAWWPAALCALATPLRLRVLAAWAWSWSKHRTLLGLVDDVAYGAGVWRGTLRAKTARSVLPRIGFGQSQSKRSKS